MVDAKCSMLPKMPTLIQFDGLKLHYSVVGDRSRPPLVLIHSLAACSEIWALQVALLSYWFRVITYDLRGHGASEVNSGFTMGDLAKDVVALLDELGIEEAGVVGLSIGGAIAQTLALRVPDRVAAMAICCSASELSEASRKIMSERISIVEALGMESQTDSTLTRWFTPDFRTQSPATLSWVAQQIEKTSVAGYVGCSRALQQLALTDRLGELSLPVLVISAEEDTGFPPATGEAMHARIPNSQFAVIPSAAHLANVEQPIRFTELLVAFFREHLG
jgi:3-oxoadipate enol-lactonase